MRGEREWGGSDILMQMEMEKHRAALDEYERAQGMKRGARYAFFIVLPFWVGIGFWIWHC